MPCALRKQLETWLNQVWYQAHRSVWQVLLLRPLRWSYQTLRAVSQQTKKNQQAKQTYTQKPFVLVIGNLIAGGAGKTPVVMATCKHLTQKGYRVGLISRGYKRSTQQTLVFTPNTSPPIQNEMGDEPQWLAQHTQCPIAVSANRTKALTALLKQHPDLDLVISDDGLQHHRLIRHMEWVVFDARAAGNRLQIPEGPLREPLDRLQHVEAILSNGLSTEELSNALNIAPSSTWFEIQITLTGFRHHTGTFITVDEAKTVWANQRILAFAGLANPNKFFQTLQNTGIQCDRTLALPDHFDYPLAYDAAFTEDILITTGKDAVKLTQPNPKRWVAEIQVALPTPLTQQIEDRLGRPIH